MAKKEIVYILTNRSLDGWIKIGMTTKNDIKQRLDELNRSTAIPLDFRVYALLYCDDARKTEAVIHGFFDDINPEIHAISERTNGHIAKKEFFQITPEKAYNVMKRLVDINPREFELVRPEETSEEKQVAKIVTSVARKQKRSKASFETLEIPVGAELEFVGDPQIKCTVVEDNKVKCGDVVSSISHMAWVLRGSKPDEHKNGNMWFKYEGETLWNRRLRLEAEDSQD